MLVKVERYIRLAGNVFVSISAIMLMLMMLIGASDVIGRYVFKKPIFGVIEISEVLMAGIVLLSWAYTQRAGGHVKVDLFTSRYPPRVKAWMNLVVLLLSLVLFIVIAHQSTLLALEYLGEGRIFPTLRFPSGPFYFFVPVGAFFVCLEFIIEIIHLVPRLRRGE